MSSDVGRFAPSPTGDLHLGNLRTALVGWLAARSVGGDFVVRMEDLDRVTSSRAHEDAQLAALHSLGIDHDGEVVRQSDRFASYDAAIDALTAADRTYDCFCTRREIRDAISAPHDDHLAYPGTCRELTPARRGDLLEAGRRPATRLRADAQLVGFDDLLGGHVVGGVDDVVLRRNDGVPAYNLAVVVDDAAQGVTQVVRGDDLVSSTPSQVLLQQLLGIATPTYLHVPLVVGADGVRLAKRHGAVTMPELAGRGVSPHDVLALLATSLGLAAVGEVVTASGLVDRFDPARIPRQPWMIPADLQRSTP
ncbi:MAG: Glutamyl-Q tRNA(Asp) synthetase [Ilumatobacteraceae bacterium]|nr:Glutamyl-Q tRNA(Asp) synthetase [Ilumatobacteraceae bacterium]